MEQRKGQIFSNRQMSVPTDTVRDSKADGSVTQSLPNDISDKHPPTFGFLSLTEIN